MSASGGLSGQGETIFLPLLYCSSPIVSRHVFCHVCQDCMLPTCSLRARARGVRQWIRASNRRVIFRLARLARGRFRAVEVEKQRSSCRLLHDTVTRGVVRLTVPVQFRVGRTRHTPVRQGQGPEAVARPAQGRLQGLHPDARLGVYNWGNQRK